MIHYIQEITDSDQEFLAIMHLLNSWVQNKESPFLYIPKYHIVQKITKKTKKKHHSGTFDEKLLKLKFGEFTPKTAIYKTKSFLSIYGGKSVYIPNITNSYKLVRNNNILIGAQSGLSYHNLSLCFHVSLSQIKKIVSTQKMQEIP